MKLTLLAILSLCLTCCKKWYEVPGTSVSCQLIVKDTIKSVFKNNIEYQLPNCPSFTSVTWTDTDTAFAYLGVERDIYVVVDDYETHGYICLPLNEVTYFSGYAIKWTGFYYKNATFDAWKDPK